MSNTTWPGNGGNAGGRYYTRSRKVEGRVLREYVGSGPLAELWAELDTLTRQIREEERALLRMKEERLDELEALVMSLDKLTADSVKAELERAGYHQHDRGEWRKRRGSKNEAETEGNRNGLGTNRPGGKTPGVPR